MSFSFDESWEQKFFLFLDVLNGREEFIDDSEFEGDTIYIEGENLPLYDTFKNWEEEGNLSLPMLLEFLVPAFCRHYGLDEREVRNLPLFEKAVKILSSREGLFFFDILEFSKDVEKVNTLYEFRELVARQVFFSIREREFLISGMAEDLMPSYLSNLVYWEKVRLALLPEEAPERESPLAPTFMRLEPIELKKFLWEFTLPEVRAAYERWLEGERFSLPRIHDKVIETLSSEGIKYKIGDAYVSPRQFTRTWALAQVLGKVLGLEAKGPFLSLKGIKQSLERFMADEESAIIPSRLKSALTAYLKGIGQDPLRYANILNILK